MLSCTVNFSIVVARSVLGYVLWTLDREWRKYTKGLREKGRGPELWSKKGSYSALELCLWCEKYTLILSLLIAIARFLLVWSPRQRFLTGMPCIWNWRSACVRNWRQLLKCSRDISTPAVCDILSMWSCALIICWHVVFVTLTLRLSLHYFEKWGGEVVNRQCRIKWRGKTEVPCCCF